LPYPEVIFEAPWKGSGVLADHEAQISEKRIALAFEHDSSLTKLFDVIDIDRENNVEEGIYIIPIFEGNNGWEVTPGCAFLPYDYKLNQSEIEKENNAKIRMMEKNAGYHARASKFEYKYTPMPLLFEICQEIIKTEGRDKFDLNVAMDVRDELSMVSQSCAVFNCANVELETLEVPERLQKSRIKKGKKPFHEYKILTIGSENYVSKISDGNNEKVVKRMHLRRGHIRRYKNGKTTWVRNTIVNKGNPRTIEKSYQLDKIV